MTDKTFKELQADLAERVDDALKDKGRLAAIARALPDADEATRVKLKAEAAQLQSGLAGAPAEIGELTRRMVLAHLAEAAQQKAEAEVKHKAIDEKIRPIEDQLYALRKEIQATTSQAWGVNRVALMPDVDELHEQRRELELEYTPLLAVREKANLSWQVARGVAIQYKVNLDQPAGWPRAAHEYAARVERQAQLQLAVKSI